MIHSRRARLPDPYFLGDRSPEDRDLPSHLVNRDLTPEQNPISAKPENLAPRWAGRNHRNLLQPVHVRTPVVLVKV